MVVAIKKSFRPRTAANNEYLFGFFGIGASQGDFCGRNFSGDEKCETRTDIMYLYIYIYVDISRKCVLRKVKDMYKYIYD